MTNKMDFSDYIAEEVDEEAIKSFIKMLKRIDMYSAKQFEKEKIDPRSLKHLCALANVLTINMLSSNEILQIPMEIVLNFVFEIISTNIKRFSNGKYTVEIQKQELPKETNIPNSVDLH